MKPYWLMAKLAPRLRGRLFEGQAIATDIYKKTMGGWVIGWPAGWMLGCLGGGWVPGWCSLPLKRARGRFKLGVAAAVARWPFSQPFPTAVARSHHHVVPEPIMTKLVVIMLAFPGLSVAVIAWAPLHLNITVAGHLEHVGPHSEKMAENIGLM